MKQLLSLAFTLIGCQSFSQEKISFSTPPPSPEASFTQQLGSGEVIVHYSRPLARGRKIFGGLVPFDSLWRTGASGNTTISISEDMNIGEKSVKAGKYSLFTIPREKEWTIILNTDTTLHGTTGYDNKKDVHRFSASTQKTGSFVEAFTINLNEITNRGSGFLVLAWENTIVKISIASPDDEKIMTMINTRLITNKEKNAELYFQAANYYYSTGRDLKQAALWAVEAEKADKENFYYPNLLYRILADLKEYKSAIAAAKRAIVLGEKKNMTNSVNSLKMRIAEMEKNK